MNASRNQIKWLKEKALSACVDAIKYFEVKHYNTVLLKQQKDNPYYLQFLEIKGIFIDGMLKINQQVEGANSLATSIAH